MQHLRCKSNRMYSIITDWLYIYILYIYIYTLAEAVHPWRASTAIYGALLAALPQQCFYNGTSTIVILIYFSGVVYSVQCCHNIEHLTLLRVVVVLLKTKSVLYLYLYCIRKTKQADSHFLFFFFSACSLAEAYLRTLPP